MLSFLPAATTSLLNVPLCTDDESNYGPAKRFICGSADLPAAGGDPKSPCLFTSIGESFQSSPASLGRAVDVEQPASLCPEATDPAKDSCMHAGP
jgi:hypothetical protein